MASSTFEIDQVLQRLSSMLAMPRGFDMTEAIDREYQRALVMFDPDILSETVDRILDGRISRKANTFPRVAELAGLARNVKAEVGKGRMQAEAMALRLKEAAELANQTEELKALRADGESQAHIMRLKTAHDANDPWLCAKLIRERHAETRTAIPHLNGRATDIATDLERVAAMPDTRRRKYADVPDAPVPEKSAGEAFGGLPS